MGRSRGGLTTKIHALVDSEGCPIHLKLTAGQAHDGCSAVDMFETISPGQVLLADRAYNSNSLHQSLKRQEAWGCIRPMPSRVNVPASTHGFISSAILSRVCSINSNTFELSQPSTTSVTLASSHQFAFG